MLQKIISVAQTGGNRAALDSAIKNPKVGDVNSLPWPPSYAVNQVDDGNFGRDEKSHGWSPGTGTPVYVEKRPIPKRKEPPVNGIELLDDEAEREDLAPVGVA